MKQQENEQDREVKKLMNEIVIGMFVSFCLAFPVQCRITYFIARFIFHDIDKELLFWLSVIATVSFVAFLAGVVWFFCKHWLEIKRLER